jgi:hypothetical protein
VTYKKRQAVANYVPEDDQDWLQQNRIELNAMRTPQFLEWLDAKFDAHKKLIPPDQVMRDQLEQDVRERLNEKITEEILEEAGIDDLVEEAFEERVPEMDSLTESLNETVTEELKQDRAKPWRDPIRSMARK